MILGYLFPTWDEGLAAMRALAESEAAPSVTRVSDAYETQFSFATRKASSRVDRAKSRALQAYLERGRGFDIEAMCLAFIGYEGSARHVAAAAAAGRADRSAATAGCASAAARAPCTTRRSSTRPTSATTCSTAARSPTCRRPSAPWSTLPALYAT